MHAPSCRARLTRNNPQQIHHQGTLFARLLPMTIPIHSPGDSSQTQHNAHHSSESRGRNARRNGAQQQEPTPQYDFHSRATSTTLSRSMGAPRSARSHCMSESCRSSWRVRSKCLPCSVRHEHSSPRRHRWGRSSPAQQVPRRCQRSARSSRRSRCMPVSRQQHHNHPTRRSRQRTQ